MKPSNRYSLLTLLEILFLGVAVSASMLKLSAFRQSAAPAQAQVAPATGDGDAADDSPNVYRSAFVQTDKADYAPGEVIVITGGGWDPGEAVALLLHEEPTIHPDRRVTVIADASGNIFDNQFMQDAHDRGVMLQLTAKGKDSGLRTEAAFGNPSASLSQWANLNNAWVSGNLGSSKASYFEGDSIPYRLTFGSLSPAPHTVTIEWDTTKSDKHALDYITTFDRSVPHVPPVAPGEIAPNPCLGVTPCPAATSFAIPADPQVTGAGVTPIPGAFKLYGGTITSLSVYSYANGTGLAGDKSARITITFTANQANPVLAWGGHIATRVNWGLGNSAVAIPGSPYHTRLIDLDGSGGNQDRSLSADSVTFPGSITIIKDASPTSSQPFTFTPSASLGIPFNLVDDPPNADDNHTKPFDKITNCVTYTVAETTVQGWTLSFSFNDPANPTWPCTVTSPNGGSSSTSGSNGVSIRMEEGENWACTFTNTRQNATLTVIKNVINDNGGTATSSSFTMTVSGASPNPSSFAGSSSGTPVSIAPNAPYDVSESGPTGYTASESQTGCHSSAGLPPGGSATCTITNDDNAATLIIIKHVIYDNGGASVASAFTETIAGVTAAGGQNVTGTEAPGVSKTLATVGAYTVTEGAHVGYEVSYSADCNASIALGETKTCTVTNDDIITSPGVATEMSWTLKDKAVITGIHRGDSCGNDTASVTFHLYRYVLNTPDQDLTCCDEAEVAIQNSNVPLVYDSVDQTKGTASIEVEVDQTGFYLWRAQYSGDTCNSGSETACGSERTDITESNSIPPALRKTGSK